MTTLCAVFALAAAYVVYLIWDANREEAIRQMNDFYEVEYKKNFVARNENAAMGMM